MIDCKSSMTRRATHRHAIESAVVRAHLQLVAWTVLYDNSSDQSYHLRVSPAQGV
ncbi:hypothetical protein [Streptomyces sp. NPDC002082]|uniref:hypothetical protein n=1 Tax=Streptomyces sp. NPDC002082 TaxID=3154772 RepID=UPI00332450EA